MAFAEFNSRTSDVTDALPRVGFVLLFLWRELTQTSEWSSPPWFLSYDFHADIASTAHTDCPGGTAAQVDRASLHERAAVIDPNDYRAAITRICDSNSRAEGQRSVSSGHRASIEFLTGCRSMSRKLLTIVSGNLGLGGTFQTGKRT
jgi:hypothetical protein